MGPAGGDPLGDFRDLDPPGHLDRAVRKSRDSSERFFDDEAKNDDDATNQDTRAKGAESRHSSVRPERPDTRDALTVDTSNVD